MANNGAHRAGSPTSIRSESRAARTASRWPPFGALEGAPESVPLAPLQIDTATGGPPAACPPAAAAEQTRASYQPQPFSFVNILQAVNQGVHPLFARLHFNASRCSPYHTKLVLAVGSTRASTHQNPYLLLSKLLYSLNFLQRPTEEKSASTKKTGLELSLSTTRATTCKKRLVLVLSVLEYTPKTKVEVGDDERRAVGNDRRHGRLTKTSKKLRRRGLPRELEELGGIPLS